MSRKRRNTSSPEPDSPRSPKRLNIGESGEDWDTSDDEDSKEAPHVNDYTGQTGAFPGIGNDTDELFYGPAADGIEYLRMVRSEAKGVPQILSAPPPPSIRTKEEEDAAHDDGGYYDDGTYTALARASDRAEKTLPVAQQYYYDNLLKHFHVVQSTMRCTPPLAVVERLHPSQLVSFPEVSRKARDQWQAHIISVDPHPAQVACIDPQSTLELIRFLRRNLILLFQHQDQQIISRVGGWLWAVLGKCRPREVLSSEEIGELRQLAQRAIRMRSKVAADSDETVSIDNDMDLESLSGDRSNNQGDPGGDAKAVSLDRDQDAAEDRVMSDSKREKLISITLDMVITVVGEVYGQRDLLESRKNWGDVLIPG